MSSNTDTELDGRANSLVLKVLAYCDGFTLWRKIVPPGTSLGVVLDRDYWAECEGKLRYDDIVIVSDQQGFAAILLVGNPLVTMHMLFSTAGGNEQWIKHSAQRLATA